MTTGKTLKDKHMTTNTKQTQESISVVDTLKLALEALEYWNVRDEFDTQTSKAITAIREALAEPKEKYIYGTPLLDAMTGKANEALDKMAENARELGLDYEPPCKTGSQCTNKCQQCEQPAIKQDLTPEQPAQQQEPLPNKVLADAYQCGFHAGRKSAEILPPECRAGDLDCSHAERLCRELREKNA